MQKFVDNKEKVCRKKYKNEADWHIDEFYLRNSCLQIGLHLVKRNQNMKQTNKNANSDFSSALSSYFYILTRHLRDA